LKSKTAHGKTSTADTLIQTPDGFVTQLESPSQALIWNIFKTGLKKAR